MQHLVHCSHQTLYNCPPMQLQGSLHPHNPQAGWLHGFTGDLQLQGVAVDLEGNTWQRAFHVIVQQRQKLACSSQAWCCWAGTTALPSTSLLALPMHSCGEAKAMQPP